MNELTQTGLYSGSYNLVIGWLEGRDQEKIEKATSTLLEIGKPAVEFLILEATKPGKRAEHKIRLLDLVLKIGAPLGPNEFFNLQELLQDHALAVRQKAEQVIVAASPPGLSDNPTSAACMRALNPLLSVPPRCRPKEHGSPIWRQAVEAICLLPGGE